MGVDNKGHAVCTHCGAQLSLFTIFNRDMRGFARTWKRRHERACALRTPAQRLRWARPYIGKDRTESALVIDVQHPAFRPVDP